MKKLRIATIVACLGLIFGPLGMQITHASGDTPRHSATAPESETDSNKSNPTCNPNASGTTSDTSVKQRANDLWTEITIHIKIRNSDTSKSKCKTTKPSKQLVRPHRESASKKGAKTTSAETKTNIYAGLGDSIAAGGGLSSDGACGRSQLAYPNIIAEEQHLKLIHAACSGATVGDLYTEQHTSGANPPPQLDTAFAQGTPELITITAGANDVRWFDFLLKCYRSTCGTKEDEQAIDTFQNLLQGKLQFALSEVQRRSNNDPPKVVLTGYYNPTSSICSSIQSQITRDELRWINLHVRELNRTLQKTGSQFKFVKFASVSFSGHDLCSKDPWIQGVNDPAPLHPTQKGQEAIAKSVRRTL